MTHVKNICLLGLSKQAELTIKTKLKQMCTEHELAWVPANAKTLDGVIINAMFLDTPQIEKYVSTVKVPCVSVYTQESGRETAKKLGIVAIKLQEPFTLTDEWLNHLLGNEKTKHTPAPESSSAPAKAHRPSEDYHKLIQIIKEKQRVFIHAACDGKNAFLSPAEQSAYLDFARSDIPGIEHWSWSQVEQIPNLDIMRRINIDQWLFETLWQSEDEAFNVDSTMLYKLIRWPQPFSQHRRSEALRLAAQIKFHPVKVSELIEKTKFPSELVEQFLYATHQANQIEVVAPTEEIISANAKIDAPKKSDPDRDTKRSFIGRLRSKLGL